MHVLHARGYERNADGFLVKSTKPATTPNLPLKVTTRKRMLHRGSWLGSVFDAKDALLGTVEGFTEDEAKQRADSLAKAFETGEGITFS